MKKIIDYFMTRSEILNKAKYIRFPSGEKDGKILDNLYYPELLEDYNQIDLPLVDLRYKHLPGNKHHFTTAYHIKYVYPVLSKIFKFDYNENEWKKQKKIVGVSDLSYIAPVKDKKFECFGLQWSDIHYIGNYKDLLYNEHVKGKTWITHYHELFAFPHSSCRIVNLSENNNRKLLVLGDSQFIPDVPFLCYFFKEVWYIDNRDKEPIYSKYIENETFDDVIISLYNEHTNKKYVNYLKN